MDKELKIKFERIAYCREWIYSITRDKGECLNQIKRTFGKECKDEETWSKIQKTEKFKDFVQGFYCDIGSTIYQKKEIIKSEKGLEVFNPSPIITPLVYSQEYCDDVDPLFFIEMTEEDKNHEKVLIQEFSILKKFLEEKYPSFDLNNLHPIDSLGKEIQWMKKNSGIKEVELKKMLKNFYTDSRDSEINFYKNECSKVEEEIDPEVLEEEYHKMGDEEKENEDRDEVEEAKEKEYRDPLVDALIFAFGFVILLVIIDLFA